MKSKTMHRIWEMMKGHLKTIMIISIISLIINVGEVVKPYLIKIVIDDYLSFGIYEKAGMTIAAIGAVYIAIVILGNILDFVTRTITDMMGENIIYHVRNKLFKYIEYANISFHDKTPAGKLFVRITSDAEDISTLFKDVISTIFKDIIMVIALLGVMIYLSKELSFFAFIIIPFIILAAVILTTIMNKLEEKVKTAKTKLNTFFAESIYGIKLIKIFNRQYEKQKECEQLNKAFKEAKQPTGIVSGFQGGIMTILENLGIALIIWACIHHWMGINIEVGMVYIFINYLKQIFDPINRIIEDFETVQEAIVSINKIYDILDHREFLEDREGGRVLDKVDGKIEFKNVWFAYEGENWVLKDVSFTIEAGKSIALVGKTGSGKTTITNLINRFYEIQKGEILLDGVNIKEINIRSLREKIGTILQDPFLFARTIKDNIQLNKNLSDEEIYHALNLCSAQSFIEGLPNGIEEVSNERGNSYSAGQKQLLAFARIFAHNPAIFILDEATANIDTHTEELIQKSIDKISREKTSIFIAHRLSTIVNVDKIIVLNHGEIIEQGSHHELLQAGGYYSKLYEAYYESIQA